MYASPRVKPEKLQQCADLLARVLEAGEQAQAIFPSVPIPHCFVVITTQRVLALDLRFARRDSVGRPRAPTDGVRKATPLTAIENVRAKPAFRKRMWIEIEQFGGLYERYGNLESSEAEEVLSWIESATEELRHSARFSLDDDALNQSTKVGEEGIVKSERGPDGVKRCPRCAETVKAQAKVCRFCGFDFEALERERLEQERRAAEPVLKKALREFSASVKEERKKQRERPPSHPASCCGCSCAIAAIPVAVVLTFASPSLLTSSCATGCRGRPGVRRSLLSQLATRLIEVYRRSISGRLPVRCRFEPSCSAYGLEAYGRYGFTTATRKTLWRVLRCNPLNRGSTVDHP